MYSALAVLALLLDSGPACAADLLGTEAAFAFEDGERGFVSFTVMDPDVELPCADGDLGLFDLCQFDVDVTADRLRIDWTLGTACYGFGGSADDLPWWTLTDLNPVTCPEGTVGAVTGLGDVTTNLPPNEWVPSQVDFDDHTLTVLGNPVSLDGDSSVCAVAGDFIEIEMLFSCVADDGFDLSVTGTCPGPAEVDVAGAPPGPGTFVRYMIGTSLDATFTMPSGPCAGTATSLGGSVRTVGPRPAEVGAAGELHHTPSIRPDDCGQFLQAIELTTCSLSNVVAL